jgi:hypothetical protein
VGFALQRVLASLASPNQSEALREAEGFALRYGVN